MDAMFWGRRARFLRRVAFLALEDANAAFRMTSGHDFVAGAVLLKHVSIFVEVSQKTLVLEVRIFSFRGSLAENARFGSSDLQFSRKSRIRRSFGSPDLQFSRKPRRI